MKLDMSGWTRNVAQGLRDSMSLEKAAGRFGAAWRDVQRDLAIAGAAITGMAALSVKAASDFEETENLFRVAYGDMADSASKWAEDTSKSLGLFEEDVLKTAGTLKVMIDSMGLAPAASAEISKNLTLLAADFSSFYNLDHETAFQKIRAGLSGEAEPLKQLGILVNETMVQNFAWANGIAKVGEELTDVQKVLGRYGVILEASRAAQGDLIRTSDSASNQFRRLQNSIKTLTLEFGEALLPAVNDMAIGLNRYLAGVVAVANAHPELVQQFARIVTGTGLAIAALGGIGLVAGPVVRAFRLIAAAAALAWAAIFSGPVIVGGAVAAIALSIAKLSRDWDIMKREVSNTLSDLDNATGNWASSTIGYLKSVGRSVVDYYVGFRKMLDEISGAPARAGVSPAARAGFDLSGAFSSLTSKMRGWWGELKDAFVPEIGDLGAILGEQFENMVSRLGLDSVLGDVTGTIQDIKRELADVVANPIAPGYTPPDFTQLLFGASESEFSAGVKAAADKAARELEQARERAVALFDQLNPGTAVVAKFMESIELLSAAELDDPLTVMRLGEMLFGDIADAAGPEIAEAIEMIRGMGDAGVVAADAMRRAWVESLDDIEDRLMEGVLELIDTTQQDVAKAAQDKINGIRGAMNDFAQSFGQVGQALSGVSDKFKGVTKAIQGIQIAVQLAGIGLQLFKAISAAVAAGVRLSWEAALGIFGLVLEMIYQLISAFALLGNKGQKELKGIAKVIDEVKQASNQWIDDLADRIVKFARTGEATFQEFVDSVLDNLARIALSELFLNPIVNYIGDILPGFAKGGVFNNGNVVPLARGGVITGPTIAPMALMGEAGPEAVMPLQRGRDGRLGVAATSGGSVNIQIHNYSGAQAETRESTGPDGTRNIEVVIRNLVRKSLRQGEFNRDLAGLYGLQRRPT